MRKKLRLTNLLTKPFIVLTLAVSQISALNPLQLIKAKLKNQAQVACSADQVFQTNNNECLEHKNEYYCVELSVTEQIGPNGNKITHTWNLGDGNLRHGPKLEHCYDEYGEYPILLISQREMNGIPIIDTTEYNVNIDEIVIIQEIKEDQFQYYFDGSNTFINQDFKIDNYYWSFGDGNFDCQVLTSNRYSKPGEYDVRLIVEGIAENGLKKRICGKKKIIIK